MCTQSLKLNKQKAKETLIAAYNSKSAFTLFRNGLITYDRFCISYIQENQILWGFDLTETIKFLKKRRDTIMSNNVLEKEYANRVLEEYIINYDSIEYTVLVYGDTIDEMTAEEKLELKEYLEDTYILLFT